MPAASIDLCPLSRRRHEIHTVCVGSNCLRLAVVDRQRVRGNHSVGAVRCVPLCRRASSVRRFLVQARPRSRRSARTRGKHSLVSPETRLFHGGTGPSRSVVEMAENAGAPTNGDLQRSTRCQFTGGSLSSPRCRFRLGTPRGPERASHRRSTRQCQREPGLLGGQAASAPQTPLFDCLERSRTDCLRCGPPMRLLLNPRDNGT